MSEEEHQFYYQKKLIPEKTKQLKFKVTAPLEKSQQRKEKKQIKTKQRKLDRYGIGKIKGLDEFLAIITIIGVIGLLYKVKNR